MAAAVIGSIATGDARGATSDLDLLLVVERRPDPEALGRTGERVADLAAGCPLRGLEAVAYRRDVLAAPRFPLRYELNVNGGRAIARLVSLGGDPAFWFLLDVTAARDHALAVTGPPLRHLIGPVPRPAVLAALRESLTWHRTSGGHGPDVVLNACRARYWLEHGAWPSKTAAGERLREHAIVDAALAARARGSDADLDPRAVAAFLDLVRADVER